MEFFRDPQFDFMRYRKHWVTVSLVLVLVSIFAVFIHGKLNLGIDFAGGTQLTMKFQQRPEIEELRRLVEESGVADAQIQSFGAEGSNEVIIKTPTVEGSEEGSRGLVTGALDRRLNGASAGGFDLNNRGRDAVAELLLEIDPDRLAAQDPETARGHYEGVAEAILELRREEGLIAGWDALRALPEVSDEAAAGLEGRAFLGSFAVLGAENVGPQIGAELRKKGVLAVVFSLLGMLIYIWLRFELRFGIGALVAVTHDVLVVLGLFALADFEFNLTTIAAFLTLVGYSVNDTVVVFDRVRENLRRSRREPLVEVMNASLNQTLSRTVLTSGTTLIAVGCLLAIGGDVLRGFAFILSIGVIVGTYSSIYVASPFALLWERYLGRAARSARATT